MKRIKIITSDSKIWNEKDVLVSISRAVYQDKIVLDLLHEGPCCCAAGIDAMLDRFDLPRDKFLIQTSNQIKSSKYPETRTGFVELEYSQKLIGPQLAIHNDLHKRFALFIGRSNWQRLGLASHLWNHHRHHSYITYHFNPQLDFHRENFGLEQYLYQNWEDQEIWKFLQSLPLVEDHQTYPITWNNTAFDIDYENVFCEIVCETYFSGDTFFVTEKTFRPIINRRPFIVQGPRWYLRNLKRLGFKTFDHWWDEGYDEDPSDARLQTLKNNIDWIAGLSMPTLRQMFEDMQETLDHNVETLRSLTQEKIIRTDFSS